MESVQSIDFNIDNNSAEPDTDDIDDDINLLVTSSHQECCSSLDSQVLAQGAEARLFKAMFLGRPAIVKQRFKKRYRHPVLNEFLTTNRMRSEIRCIARCQTAGILVPAIYHVDIHTGVIIMQFIEGAVSLRQYFSARKTDNNNKCQNQNGSLQYDAESVRVAATVGKLVASLHCLNIIHGDLTTSNMLLKSHASNDHHHPEAASLDIVLIDFGLSYVSTLVEDKGVDLYVLERSFLSTHPNSEALFEEILRAYEESYKGSAAVTRKLHEVRQRGRKREMVG